jgi:hypothetical protein
MRIESSTATRAASQAGHGGGQLARVDRFRDMHLKTGQQRTLSILRPRKRR